MAVLDLQHEAEFLLWVSVLGTDLIFLLEKPSKNEIFSAQNWQNAFLQLIMTLGKAFNNVTTKTNKILAELNRFGKWLSMWLDETVQHVEIYIRQFVTHSKCCATIFESKIFLIFILPQWVKTQCHQPFIFASQQSIWLVKLEPFVILRSGRFDDPCIPRC